MVEKGNIREERLYLGNYERYRKYVNNILKTERQTLHIIDDRHRFALIDRLTIDNGITLSTATNSIRYQYDNHLGSASLELDQTAAIISYEEYHPFGTTSYRSGRTETEVSQKRYKYVGKERDEETGLYYYGARYYAAWLCRFVSVDPLQFKYPHYTPYQYAGNKPVSYIDLDGLEEEKPENIDDTSSNGSPNGMETIGGISQLKINIDGSTEEIEDSNFYYCLKPKGDKFGRMVSYNEEMPEYKNDNEEFFRVTKLTNSREQSTFVKYNSFKSLSNLPGVSKNDSVFVFTDGGEAEKFYQFAAFSSTSEWAFAKGKEIKTGGFFSSFVGTNRKEGSTSLLGVFSKLGDIFSKFSHSHANDTNGPTIWIRDHNNTIENGGDLYVAKELKRNAEYEVLEVTPFVQIGARYVYTKDSYY